MVRFDHSENSEIPYTYSRCSSTLGQSRWHITFQAADGETRTNIFPSLYTFHDYENPIVWKPIAFHPPHTQRRFSHVWKLNLANFIRSFRQRNGDYPVYDMTFAFS